MDQGFDSVDYFGNLRSSTRSDINHRGFKVDAGFKKLRKIISLKNRGQTAFVGNRNYYPSVASNGQVAAHVMSSDKINSRMSTANQLNKNSAMSRRSSSQAYFSAPAVGGKKSLTRSGDQNLTTRKQLTLRSPNRQTVLPGLHNKSHGSGGKSDSMSLDHQHANDDCLPTLPMKESAELTVGNVHRLRDHFGDNPEEELEERIMKWLDDCNRLWTCFQGMRYGDLHLKTLPEKE